MFKYLYNTFFQKLNKSLLKLILIWFLEFILYQYAVKKRHEHTNNAKLLKKEKS